MNKTKDKIILCNQMQKKHLINYTSVPDKNAQRSMFRGNILQCNKSHILLVISYKLTKIFFRNKKVVNKQISNTVRLNLLFSSIRSFNPIVLDQYKVIRIHGPIPKNKILLRFCSSTPLEKIRICRVKAQPRRSIQIFEYCSPILILVRLKSWNGGIYGCNVYFWE